MTAPSRQTAAPGQTNLTGSRWIDPATLMQLASLEVRARHVVEGFLAGANRSPKHGFSVEFTEYRPYSTGDDLRYLDWRLYARTDRYYLKQYEDETNLRCTLVLDTSASMNYGSKTYTKLDYARTLIATLGYFLTTQRDAVGLGLFTQQLDEFVPARFRTGHLRRMLHLLDEPLQSHQSATPTSSSFEISLSQLMERLTRRGLVVVVSDWLAPQEQLSAALQVLSSRGQEVLIVQVLDPVEWTLDLPEPVWLIDAETGTRRYVDPATAAAGYQQRITEHCQRIEQQCEQCRLSYSRLLTTDPLETALPDLLRLRQQTHSAVQSRPGGRT